MEKICSPRTHQHRKGRRNGCSAHARRSARLFSSACRSADEKKKKKSRQFDFFSLDAFIAYINKAHSLSGTSGRPPSHHSQCPAGAHPASWTPFEACRRTAAASPPPPSPSVRWRGPPPPPPPPSRRPGPLRLAAANGEWRDEREIQTAGVKNDRERGEQALCMTKANVSKNTRTVVYHTAANPS